MIKNFKNVFKLNKSKLTMEELQICLKVQKVSLITFIISMIIMFICIIAFPKGIVFCCIQTAIFIIWLISLILTANNQYIDIDIQKLEEVKKYNLKAKNIINLIKEGKFDKIYCVDKDINKLLFDISLEKGNIEISIEKGNIVIRTYDGIEIPLKVENVNDYFGMY